MLKDTTNENVKKLAEQIVSYETRDKGAMGNLFAFEARDGFWSKLIKTLTPIAATAITFAAVTNLVAGPVGLLAGAAVGLVSGAINRTVNESMFSNLHDSHKSNLGKFGHYLGVSLGANLIAAAAGGLAGVSGLGTAAADLIGVNVVAPLAIFVASKGITSGFGDPQLRRESEQAREIAGQAIQSGQSVEQLLSQEKPARQVSNYTVSESHEQAPEQSRKFTNMIEQQRLQTQGIER